ncbi:Regulation of nuclear pre-mRNA domain-containing protein [Drosera capensis]
MNSLFSEQILADKLSKLNSTQQCIESKAEVVVATWNKQFQSSQMAQKVPLLYLANDILQNSKRKGNEFVTGFWKVLPGAVKDVSENGDERGKNVVLRLVKIWDERKVFGSHSKNLKNVMLADELPPPLEFSKKRSRGVKIVKRDSRSIRTKLTVGGAAEKIVSAFHSVLSDQSNEDVDMTKCKSAVNRVRKMEQEVDLACRRDPRRKALGNELAEEEVTLKRCIEKLKLFEANRLESELENIRTQMQVAQAQLEEANNMRKQLNDETYVSTSNPVTGTPHSVIPSSNTGAKPKKTAADIAAEVADKLAASSSSQLIMSSVLSSFAAQEAKNAGLTTSTGAGPNSHTTASEISVPNILPKVEQLPSGSDPNVFMPAQRALVPPSHSYQSVMVAQPMMQNPNPSTQPQYQLHPGTPTQPYMQPSGATGSYGYGSLPHLPAPQPAVPPQQLQPQMVNTMMTLVPHQLQITHQQQMPIVQPAPINQMQPMMLMQKPPVAPSNFRPQLPPGMAYFGHPHHSQ